MEQSVLEQVDPTVPAVDTTTAGDAGLVDDLLVEEVSIDGMCGVY
jgi:mycofactocin precursor